MSQCEPPKINGRYRVVGHYLEHQRDQPIDLCNPIKFGPAYVTIKQNNLFFTYQKDNDDRPPNLGIFEAVYFNGCFQGWKAHLVDTQFDDENYIFNFSKINHCGKVQEFIITYVESGFGLDPKQKPRVEHAVASRVHKHKH